MSSKAYDIILFGVTGFTGKLVAEYLWHKQKNLGSTISWAVSARNASKAESVLQELCGQDDESTKENMPNILVADLECKTPEDRATLQEIVQQTKVVLTCSGPFEKYGPTLVELCAQHGVYYADITGESDYFRQMIEKYDRQAQESGAAIVFHCGHDCIPCDLLVWEMNQYASQKGYQLKQVMTFQEFSEEAAFSGGTAATAAYQLSKDRKNTATKPNFDPLMTAKNGEESKFRTKNVCPKRDVEVPMLPGRTAGPWIMAPVMMNCVRRSNALLGYSPEFEYGDSAVKVQSWTAWTKNLAMTVAMGVSIHVPTLSGLVSSMIPKSGEGPSREEMERGFLKLYATAIMVDKNTTTTTTDSNNNNMKNLQGLFHFRKDTGYLYTAALLCETGLLLVEKYGTLEGGCLTPATALGGSLTERILKELEASLEIKEVP